MCQAFLEPGDRYGAVLSTSRLSFSGFLTQIHPGPTLLGHRTSSVSTISSTSFHNPGSWQDGCHLIHK